MGWNTSESGWITENPSINAMPRPNIEHGTLSRTAVNRIEMRKSVPPRHPSNEDSTGIEIVGKCNLPAAARQSRADGRGTQ